MVPMHICVMLNQFYLLYKAYDNILKCMLVENPNNFVLFYLQEY